VITKQEADRLVRDLATLVVTGMPILDFSRAALALGNRVKAAGGVDELMRVYGARNEVAIVVTETTKAPQP